MGLTLPQVYRHVTLPMAYRIVIPPMTSEFLTIFKNSSTALTIGVLELTAQSRQISEYTFKTFEAFTAATLIYIVITMTVIFAMRALESRVAVPGYHRPGRGPLNGSSSTGASSGSTASRSGTACSRRSSSSRIALAGGIFFGTLLALARLSRWKAALGAGGGVREPDPLDPLHHGDLLVLLPHPDDRARSSPGSRARRWDPSPRRSSPSSWSSRPTTPRSSAPASSRSRAASRAAAYALGHELLAVDGPRGAAAGLPQHAAGDAHAGRDPLPGHLPRLRGGAQGLPRRGLQGRASSPAASSSSTSSSPSSSSSSASPPRTR